MISKFKKAYKERLKKEEYIKESIKRSYYIPVSKIPLSDEVEKIEIDNGNYIFYYKLGNPKGIIRNKDTITVEEKEIIKRFIYDRI